MPNQTELTRMQQTAVKKMPTLAKIKRLKRARNDYGGEELQYITLFSNVPCRIVIAGNAEAGNPNAVQGDFRVSFPAGTGVEQTHRIEIDGVEYAVVGRVYKKSYEVTRDVDVKRV